MSIIQTKLLRVLGLAPSARGIGFAVMEGKNTLVDWGVKAVKGDKNARSLSNVVNLVEHYKPDSIALEDVRVKGSRRSARIKALEDEIVALAKRQNIRVKLFALKKVKFELLRDAKGTKHAVAEALATKFPDELGFRLPQRRRLWMASDYRMDIFDAVALANHFLHFWEKPVPSIDIYERA